MLFLRSMEQKLFSDLLGDAFQTVANRHGQYYPEGGAMSWGLTGASYLGFALCGLPSTELRATQYRTREQFGPVILDCKWYDALKAKCLNGEKEVDVMLPGPNDTLCRCTVTQELFLEMLDFCREG